MDQWYIDWNHVESERRCNSIAIAFYSKADGKADGKAHHDVDNRVE